MGSLSKAAEKLGLSHAAASRYPTSLEDRLGARLIERTTRRLWLTEAGREYHQRCAAMLAEMQEADAVNAATLTPSGVSRRTDRRVAGVCCARQGPRPHRRACGG